MIRALCLLAPALALASCGGAGTTADAPAAATAAAVAPPAGSQWTEVVNQSPAGGYVMGNPDAPVKLVEFGSLTCHVCADFAEAGFDPLQDYVRSGTVSFELRPFIRNGLDLVATRLTECVPTGAFFPVSEALYADQKAWAFDNEAAINAALTGTTDIAKAAPAIASAAGLDARFAQRGLSTAAQNQCLSDTAAFDTLAKRTQSAVDEFDITGTPTFVLNGQTFQIEVDPTKGSMWEQVERAITRAGGRKA